MYVLSSLCHVARCVYSACYVVARCVYSAHYVVARCVYSARYVVARCVYSASCVICTCLTLSFSCPAGNHFNMYRKCLYRSRNSNIPCIATYLQIGLSYYVSGNCLIVFCPVLNQQTQGTVVYLPHSFYLWAVQVLHLPPDSIWVTLLTTGYLWQS